MIGVIIWATLIYVLAQRAADEVKAHRLISRGQWDLLGDLERNRTRRAALDMIRRGVVGNSPRPPPECRLAWK